MGVSHKIDSYGLDHSPIPYVKRTSFGGFPGSERKRTMKSAGPLFKTCCVKIWHDVSRFWSSFSQTWNIFGYPNIGILNFWRTQKWNDCQLNWPGTWTSSTSAWRGWHRLKRRTCISSLHNGHSALFAKARVMQDKQKTCWHDLSSGMPRKKYSTRPCPFFDGRPRWSAYLPLDKQKQQLIVCSRHVLLPLATGSTKTSVQMTQRNAGEIWRWSTKSSSGIPMAWGAGLARQLEGWTCCLCFPFLPLLKDSKMFRGNLRKRSSLTCAKCNGLVRQVGTYQEKSSRVVMLLDLMTWCRAAAGKA